MPSYELSLIVKTLSRPALVATLKRTAEMILDQGGYLRKFVSLGHQTLPYRMKAGDAWHREGNYFIIQFDAPPTALEQVTDSVRRDIDVIRPSLVKMRPPSKFTCTLEEELQPPAYRKDVTELIESEGKGKKPLFKRNIPGLDYNPFQK